MTIAEATPTGAYPRPPERDEAASLVGETTVTLPKLMGQRDVAAYLGKSEAWCERARWAGTGPKYIKLGRHVRYRADDLIDWIEANAVVCGGE